MESRITNEVLESYLKCKFKAHLKLNGEHGVIADYESLMTKARVDHAREASRSLGLRHRHDEVQQNVEVTAAILRTGSQLIVNATVNDETLSIKFDGLKRVEGQSRLGSYHYVPILFVAGEKPRPDQRLFLQVCGLIVGDIQGKQPGCGFVIRGERLSFGKVHFKGGMRSARLVLDEVKKLLNAASPPPLILNDHCGICEFRQKCHLQAVNEDNLSLLRSIGPKEIKSYARKGIFTITQLAHTFRPHRRGKRAERRSHRRYHALNALAIRDKFIYVFGTPELLAKPVSVFLDIEGKPDEGFVYLIGMIIVRNGVEERRSFWANTEDEECQVFEHFLDEMEQLNPFVLFSYGGYEKAFFKRMKKKTHRKDVVDRVLESQVNILSLIYSHFYFPCHSNSLKEVGRCLGFTWSEIDASGIQSIAWRIRWESTNQHEWKQKLTTYNMEDCLALKRVTEFIRAVSDWTNIGAEKPVSAKDGPQVALVHDIDRRANISKWGANRFVHPEFSFINDCAYFDYQRERVFVRTTKILRRRRKPRKWVHHNRNLRKSKDYVVVNTGCPFCKSGDLVLVPGGRTDGKETRHKRAFDLVVTPGGVRRKVIECRSPVHLCQGCGRRFIPSAYENLDKHFHALKSWSMYLHVAHQISFGALHEMLKEMFNIHVCDNEIVGFKTLLARMYQPTYRMLMEKILVGHVLHCDETEVKLKTSKGNVWVFASLEEVVYMFRPNREGAFLQELLSGFHGVLVSDFYAAYDSIGCPQQKCLIHLIRDINQDLLNHPFDEELRSITQPFGTLLQSIVATVDQHGLRRRFLEVHEAGVRKFFRGISERSFSSEAAEALRDRFIRYQDKLFTFIRYDGVPWNNNCAENAIKRFAYYREGTVGTLTEAGLNHYLVLLSIFQTCRYKGISFLKFLLSRELDIDAFCTGKRTRDRAPLIEVFPDGFVPPPLRPPAKATSRRRCST
jgi:predicted RecB family nuclease